MCKEECLFVGVMPHGPLEEIFPGVYMVTGTSNPEIMGERWRYSRNMFVIVEGDELVLLNSVRLGVEGLEQLESLGTPKHVIRLGHFHGMDDAFYVDRYDLSLWAMRGMEDEHGAHVDHVLESSPTLPIHDASLFVFETSSAPESALLLSREGGILISCDSLQNWVEPDAYFDEASIHKMKHLGFFQAGNIGPGWKMMAQPERADFDRLQSLTYRHLLSAHGTPLLDAAHEVIGGSIAKTWGP